MVKKGKEKVWSQCRPCAGLRAHLTGSEGGHVTFGGLGMALPVSGHYCGHTQLVDTQTDKMADLDLMLYIHRTV